jgi:hypothetical protein
VAKQAKRERQRLNREARREAELAATKRRKQMRTGRNIAILLVPLVIVFVFFQLRSSGGSEPDRTFSKRGAVTLKPDTLYTARIETSEGNVAVALDATAAPESVKLPASGRVVILTLSSALAASLGSVKPKSAVENV